MFTEPHEYTFHPVFVRPYYGRLMNLNFLREPEKDILNLFNEIRLVSQKISDDVLIQLLFEGWRQSKVAAWIIGLTDRQDLIQKLNDCLMIKGISYPEHILYNLLILQDKNCIPTLHGFIVSQVEYALKNNHIWDIERLNIIEALAVLEYLSCKYDCDFSLKIKESHAWMSLQSEIADPKRRLGYFDEQIKCNTFLNSIFKVVELVEKSKP